MEIRAPQADMPEWKVVKSMTLFAQEVMPRVAARLARTQAAVA